LEERLVLNAAGMPTAGLVQPPDPSSAHHHKMNHSDAVRAVHATRAAVGAKTLTALQLHAAYARAFRATQAKTKAMIATQVQQLYAHGMPTSQELGDFDARIGGTVAAANYHLASMIALLPGSSNRLVPRVEYMMLANRPNSLVGRIQTSTLRNNVSPTRLQHAINREVGRSFQSLHLLAARFFENIDFNRALVHPHDQPMTLLQFMGNQAVNQFGNTLGSLALAFPNVGGTTLFPNGATTATPLALQQFQQMFTPALGLAAFQLGGNLQLFPGSSSLTPALQTSMFGTVPSTTVAAPALQTASPDQIPVTNLSLLEALQGLPTTSAAFAGDVPTVFNNGFTTLTTPMSSFFRLPSGTTFTLPTTNLTGVFSPTFTASTFQSGFLGGFGTGFPGFGVAPTTFNTQFGTGFNNFVSTVNPSLGFTVPTVGGLTTIV
jgi:hypothetical protein